VRLVVAALDDGGAAVGERRQHPRLGDIEDRAECRDAEGRRTLHVRWHRAHDQAELVLRDTTAGNNTVPSNTFEIGTPAPEQPRRVPAARFSTLAPGVHEVVLHDADTRSLVVEFRDHVVLCETSVDNESAERLLAAIAQHLPGKPVRHVLFGHYHPHYTGGLRPVMARGAAVVAPPLGAAFAAEIAARPFRSPPDALAASGHTPVIETFQGARTFRDDTNELVAIDIGADSHHTDEYVVFHLPRQRLLFQGDLGWFAGPSGLTGSGERTRGLLRAIDARALDVVTVVQSWPTRGLATLPLAELRALAAKP
jgi:glyoxylase-like metal-dependent hydrolase (beta-lactamase superfamily II)